MDRNHDEKLDATEFKSNPVPMDMEIKPVIPQAPFLRSFGWVKASPTQYQQGLSTASDEVKAKLEAQHRGVRPNISILNQDEFKLSLPDREFVSSNSAAFALVDEPDKVAFSRAKELALLPDAEAKTRINAEAPELARQLYQKHLNVTPTPQQVELVKKVMEVALEGYGMRTQFTTLSQEAAQLNRAVASVKAGTAPPEGIEVNLSLRYDGSCTIPKEVETVKVTSQNVSEIEYQIQNPTKAFNEGLAKGEFYPAAAHRLATGEYISDDMLGIGGPCNNEDWVRGGKSIGSKEYELLSDSIVTKNAGTSAQITPEEVDAKIGKGGFHAENMRATGFCAVANTREMTNQESQLKEINAEMRKARFNESPFPSSQLGPKIDRPPTLSPFYEKGIGAGADFAGGMISGSWIMLGFLGSIRVLSSVPSDCYTCIRPSVPVPSEQFPASIEPYPKRDEVGAIVRGLTIGPKQGLLVREYPGEEEQAATTECVPPGFLSTDSQGRYYVVNMASNESFGGRIFRYNPTNMKGTRGTLNPFSVEQELVGAVTYFNLNIQLARPAYPVAMTVGPKYQAKDETGKMITTQDLFVANIDVIDGKRQILKVPISLIDTKASVYGPANRHRIVGLPVIESDEFYFTGPSDMEVGPDPNSSVLAITENSVIMLSDESNIFAFYNPYSGKLLN
jgi:hypothetical protein